MLNFKNKQIVLGVFAGIILVYILSSFVIERRQYEMQVYLDTQIQEKNEDLRNLAAVTARGEATSDVEKFIPECESGDRVNFDILLGSLDDGLSAAELEQLGILFDRCGQVFASRRAAMVLELEREVENLRHLNTLKSMLKNGEVESALSQWVSLIEKEKSISSQFLALVSIQEQIIKALQSGEVSGSVKIDNINKQANEIQNSLATVTKEASDIRAGLIRP